MVMSKNEAFTDSSKLLKSLTTYISCVDFFQASNENIGSLLFPSCISFKKIFLKAFLTF